MMKPRLAANFWFVVLLSCLFCCSRPYLKQPVTRSAPSGVELLIVKKGNYPGSFGHVALRYQDDVFGYWESHDHKLDVGHFQTDTFFWYYLAYQQRDMQGFELEISSPKTRKILRILHEENEQPLDERPPYGMISNNCVVATYRVLCEALDKKEEEAPPLRSFMPGGLEKWTKKNFIIVKERYYASTRHLYMKKRKDEGKSTANEYFPPFSRSDPHAYRSWRLVYTEDLRGTLLLLRPVAGVGNVITGVVQLGLSPVFLLTGKAYHIPGGLYGVTASLPECVFLPFRRAGKTPWHPDEATRIIGSWEPERNRAKQQDLLTEYGRRYEAAAPGDPGEMKGVSK